MPLRPDQAAVEPAPDLPPRPHWARPALLVIAALAGVTYVWGAGHGSLELYYEAAVRSMGTSWHDFIYGAFDPAGTVSVDKLPGAFWVQALSVRLFGFHPWAILLPQFVEGVATVLVLYRAVSRLAGAVAGLVAAAVVAITPAAVALNRGNISDSLLIFLLVLAANATVTAVLRRRPGWLLVAGLWVGLAFQAKMLEAWLVWPGLGLVWLATGPGRPWRRVLHVGAAVVVTATISLSWMTAVSLVPRGDRPYVDGSTHDSLYQQVFTYNGFGRISTGSAGPLTGQRTAFTSLVDFRLPGATGPTRLLDGAAGRDVGWLVPLALVSTAAALIGRRRRPRDDPLRAAAILWGSWLVVDLAVFSVLTGINAYYLAALAPAVGALCGIGVELLRRSGIGRRPVAAAVVLLAGASAGYGMWLTSPAATSVRLLLLAAAVVLVATGAGLIFGRANPGPARPGVPWRGRAVLGCALLCAAVALGPTAASTDIVVAGLGPFDTPYQPASITNVTQTEPKLALTDLRAGLALLLRANRADRYVSATFTSIIAAPLIIDTGREFEPIGGFTGSIPAPTVAALRRQIDARQLQTIISPRTDNPDIEWVRAHCTVVPDSAGAANGGPISAFSIFFCGPGR